MRKPEESRKRQNSGEPQHLKNAKRVSSPLNQVPHSKFKTGCSKFGVPSHSPHRLQIQGTHHSQAIRPHRHMKVNLGRGNISMDPPLPAGVKAEILLKVIGPNTVTGRIVVSNGERVMFEDEGVARRIEKGEKVAPPKKAASRLSKEKVLKITDALAKKKGFDLKFYPNRKAQYFSAESGASRTGRAYWSVYYERKPSRGEADFFAITVDDATEKLDYWGGLAP